MFSRFMAHLIQMMIIFWGFTPHSEFYLFSFREMFCLHILFGSGSGGCRNDMEEQNVLIIWEGLREFWPFTAMEGARGGRFCNEPMRVESCKLNLLLLQSALKPLWVLACSTIVEYSQQGGFYRVPLPVACQTPNLEDQWPESSNSQHRVTPRLKWRERTPAVEDGTIGEKLPRIFPKVATSTSLLCSFTCSKFTTWDQRLYFPSEGRRAEDFFAWKIWRLRPGFEPANSGTRGQHAYL